MAVMYWSSENQDEFRRIFNGPAATSAKDVQVRKIRQIYGNVQRTGSDLCQRCMGTKNYKNLWKCSMDQQRPVPKIYGYEKLDKFMGMFNGPAATCAKDVRVQKIRQIYGNV
jgi:hypothetical protein